MNATAHHNTFFIIFVVGSYIIKLKTDEVKLNT